MKAAQQVPWVEPLYSTSSTSERALLSFPRVVLEYNQFPIQSASGSIDHRECHEPDAPRGQGLIQLGQPREGRRDGA